MLFFFTFFVLSLFIFLLLLLLLSLSFIHSEKIRIKRIIWLNVSIAVLSIILFNKFYVVHCILWKIWIWKNIEDCKKWGSPPNWFFFYFFAFQIFFKTNFCWVTLEFTAGPSPSTPWFFLKNPKISTLLQRI